MAFEVTAPLFGRRVEPPLGPGPRADPPDVGMEINEACWGSRRWGAWRAGGNRAGRDEIDSVLGVRLFLVAMDIVVTALAGRADFIDPVDQMNPMEVILPVNRVIKVCSRSVAGSSGRERGYVMTSKTEIEVGGVEVRRSRKSILIIGAADAPVR